MNAFKKVSIWCIFILYSFKLSYAFAQVEIQNTNLPTYYSWLVKESDLERKLADAITPPVGFKRISDGNKLSETWYRNLPLLEKESKVMLYNGQYKNRQDVHEAIINIDIGNRDLQQCADAIMRLRAEYLYHQKKYKDITFDFTNGQSIPYSKWRDGYKIQFKNNKAIWVKSNQNHKNYASFKKYMNLIFAYAGTYSLSKQLSKVEIDDVKIGDLFIQGGFPGHAVLVVDVVVNNLGDKYILLSQSYMPAQNIHIIKNHSYIDISPWYSIKNIKAKNKLITPEWTFSSNDLKRF